ncbi:nicotinate-nucleotide--dimethylbenzimidazole phosphoribosyltransferase [Streptomyces sp. NPDC002788]
MTDTGQVPGEGLPENAGMVEQPGAPAHGSYTYLSESTAEDEDLLLLPGAQGAWGNEVPPPAPEPVVETVHQPGPHEISGRDSGSVDLGGVRLPDPPPIPPITPRRPLHLGPPLPGSSTSPVRSLADRGPADAPVRQPAAPSAGPEYLDAPGAARTPAPPAAPWGAQVPAPAQVSAGAAPAETVVPATVPVGTAQADATHTAPQPAEAAQAAHAEQPAQAAAVGEPAGQVLTAEGSALSAQGMVVDSAGAGTGPDGGQVSAAEAGRSAAAGAETAGVGLVEGQAPTAAVAGDPAGVGTGPDAGQAPTAAVAGDLAGGNAGSEADEAAASAPAAGEAGPEADQAVVSDPAAAEAGPVESQVAVAEPEAVPAQDAAVAGADPDGAQSAAAEAVSAPGAVPPPPAPVPVVDAAGHTGEPEAAAPQGAQPDAAVDPADAGEQPPVAAEQSAPAPEDAPAPAAVPFPEAPVGPEPAVVAPPEAAVEEAAGAPEAVSQATDAVAPDVAAPEVVVEAPAAPEATPAEAAAPAPEATAPQPATPEAPAPEADAPEVAAPETPAPEADAPEVAAPEAPAPETVAPEVPAREAAAPEAAAPEAAAPEGETQADAPEASAPPQPQQPAEAPAQAPEAVPAPAPGAAPTPAAEAVEPEAVAEEAAPAPDPVAEPVPESAPAPDPVAEPVPESTDPPASAEDVTVVLPGPTPDERSAQPVQGPQQSQPAQPGTPEAQETPEAVAAVPAPRDGDAPLAQSADDLDTRAADQEDQEEESAVAVAEARQSTGPAAPGYAPAEREAVLKVMRERRDIRNGFRSDPIPHEVLLRVLEAAHHAPSVGHSQPWDFVVIRSADTRRAMHELAMRQREAYARSLPKGRAKQFKELKIEAILDTPVNIVVTADPTRGGRHTLGRHTQPQMAPYSAALAVENLWLAARAEGLGVGWVSFFDEREMVRALGLPEHLEVIAYLCVGYVDEFPDEPELLQAGWSKRRPLSWVVHEETYGRRALPGEEPHDLLAETVAQIRPLDAKALGEAWERQKRMTKPAGALGMLEIISAQLSGLSRQCPPPIPEPAAVAIFAGDHGVHAQGVTPWPQEVTAQMVANFLGGGAVCNAFATQVGAEVCIVDVGVAADLPATPGLLPRKVRAGTSDLTTGPAMTREEARQAIEIGIETARDLVAAGNKALLTGEMGIANTTASAALISVFTGADPAEVTGRGTGINDETLARKTEVVRRALELHQPDPADPIGVLAAIGGFEHAAIVGLLLGGASLRTPVILDGVSAGAAALVARAIAPEVLAACIAGHRSAEPGHVAALNKLGLRPLVDLDLRLGEGTGALLALPLVQSTARAMHEVATFDSAGVTEK